MAGSPFRGLPVNTAPRWLRHWLDCVDGAVVHRGIVRDGHYAAIVTLHRGGGEVGVVSIDTTTGELAAPTSGAQHHGNPRPAQ